MTGTHPMVGAVYSWILRHPHNLHEEHDALMTLMFLYMSVLWPFFKSIRRVTGTLGTLPCHLLTDSRILASSSLSLTVATRASGVEESVESA